MTSNQSFPSELHNTGMPSCIRIEVGPLKLAAILSSSSWLSLMTYDVYCRIQELCRNYNLIKKECSINNEKITDGCGGSREILKRVEVNALIERRLIPIEVVVVNNFAADLILGGEFISSVKGSLHFEVGAFKWQYQNNIIISRFITNPEELNIRPIDDDETISDENVSSEDDSNWTDTSDTDDPCWGCDLQTALFTMALHERLARRVSEKNKKSSQTASSNTQSMSKTTGSKTQKNAPKETKGDFYELLRNCFLNDQKATKTTKKSNATSNAKSPSDRSTESVSGMQKTDQVSNEVPPANTDKKWKSVYVMTKELHDIFGGSSMAYNGIFWSKRNKLNLVFGEELDDKSREGFHLIAVAKLLQIAQDRKWSSLRVVSNNPLVTHLLKSYLLTERLGSREDLHFFTKVDYKAYEYTCKCLNVVGPIKFECVDPSEISEMRKLERIIDAYILNQSSD